MKHSHALNQGPMQRRGRLAAQADIAQRGIAFARAFAAATSYSSEWFSIGYRDQLAAHGDLSS